MVNKRDYYEVLGLKKDVSEKELKSAYRKLVKKYHPDANPDDAGAEAKMKEVNEAFAVLSDPQKRADYDQRGHAATEQRGGARRDSGPFSGGFAGGFEGGFGGGFGGGDANYADIFGGGFGEYFAGNRKKNEPGRGRDIKANLRITYEEAMAGTQKEVTINYAQKCATCNGTGSRSGTAAGICPQCNGTGQERVITQSAFGKMTQTRQCTSCGGTGKDMKEACYTCSGKGYIMTRKTIMVKIPRDTVNGQTITINDMGEPGAREDLRGDLVIKVTVRPKRTL